MNYHEDPYLRDEWERMRFDFIDPKELEGMFSAVRCTHCGGVYDLGKVEVTGRYTDCSIWKAPCCGRTVDDRGETGWKTFKDYEYINKRER